MVGVMKYQQVLLFWILFSERKAHPRRGISPIKGTFCVPLLGASLTNPPMTSVCRWDQDLQPTQTDFLKTKMTEGAEVKFGAWDKGTPQDWSKLIRGNKPDPNADKT